MKLYKPIFSITVITIQMILSIIEYREIEILREENPEFCYISHGESLFLFILIIGIYEILTKPSWFKNTIRILLVCLVLGTQFSEYIPIDQFFFAVFNTAWFIAAVAIILFAIRFVKYGTQKLAEIRTNRKQNHTH